MARCIQMLLLALSIALLLATYCAAETRYVLITVLHTNDMHGQVMPRGEPGGLTRTATLIRQIRSQMPNVLLLDAGDIIHGTPEDYLFNGRATISAMNAIGYDMATTGNHEYDFGLDTFDTAAATATFPFLAANIHAISGDLRNNIEPYIILNVDSIRVAILGLTTLETITLHWPNSIKDIKVEDPFETAKTLVPVLRNQADVVMVLSHLGADQDMLLAKEVPGIDFIVGGHSHSVIADWRWVDNTLITQSGAMARALGRIDFIVRKDENGAEIMSINGKGRTWNTLAHPPLGQTYPELPLIEVNNAILEDEDVLRAYIPFRIDADAVLGQVVADCPTAIPGGRGESPAGNLVADAVRFYAKSDVAVIDGGSLNASGLKPGAVTVGAIFGLIGGYTRQHIVTVKMSGDQLRTALYKRLAKTGSSMWSVSGATLAFDEKNGLSITEFDINGKPLQPSYLYTVAAQAYVMMDMMQYAPDVIVLAEPNETTREAVTEYAKALRVVAAPALGRIKKL